MRGRGANLPRRLRHGQARWLAVIAVLVPVTASAQEVRVRLLDSASLKAPALTESSGLAVSRRAGGVYWTHNDSGDRPLLYATDSAGHDLGAVRIAGARARDWEDLAGGPCVVAPAWCLYIADIGDNRARRPHVVIYRLLEPSPPHGPADVGRSVPLLDSLLLRYPDRPHDAEAVAVLASGTIFLITKDRSGPAWLYRASARGPATQILQRVGPLPIRTGALAGRLVTGAAVSPDDALLVVRTYVSLHVFRLAGDSLVANLTGNSGITIPIAEPQGEAIAFDGVDRLVLTSEQGASPAGSIMRLTVRGLR